MKSNHKKSNKALKKSRNTGKMIGLFCAVLLVVGIFLTVASYGAEILVAHHERLDTGVVFIWEDGKGHWQYGLYPGGPCDRSFSLDIGKGDYKNFNVTSYNGSNFSFSGESNCHWNETDMAHSKSEYDNNYIPYAADYESASVSYDSSSGTLDVENSVILQSAVDFDVADYVRQGRQSEVYAYLGPNPPASITGPMNQMLTDPDIKGYLYFCPLVITYDEMRELGFLEAILNVPEEVKVGNSFDIDAGGYASDGLKYVTLEEVRPDGTTTLIKRWEGKGTPDEEIRDTITVQTRKDPDREGYSELSYDGGETWVDGPKIEIE